MANIDMSLDDIISKSGEGVGRTRSSGRRPAGGGSGVVRGGRPPRGGAERNSRPSATGARRSAAPYQRGGGRKTGSGEDDHLQNASVADVAASSNPTLKVKSDSKPNTVAGAICNIVREARNNKPPSILATGPQAINQAIKAIAIARKYLLDEDTPIDLQVVPKFEQDIRSGSNVVFEMGKCRPIGREPEDNDLSAKEHTDAFKLAGAIAGRVRDGEEVAVTM